jgi:hypothetical protein
MTASPMRVTTEGDDDAKADDDAARYAGPK